MPSRDQLIQAQLKFWPDSRIMKFDEVLVEWGQGGCTVKDKHYVPFDLAWKLEEDFDTSSVDITFLFTQWRACRARIEALICAHQTMQSIAMAVADDPHGVFYECGKNEDGTYRWRGFRYGLEGHEYRSGFSL